MRPLPRNNRIIRCFVSSTFVDMTLERNLLQKYIVPELKAYCRTKGWQFEVIDLRWGISAEAASHHKTMRICLNELKRCVELSPRPNFILLLGQRYGWRPIPENLPCADFNYVSERCTETEREVLHCWYQLTSDEDYQLLPCTTELTEDVYNRDEPIIRGVFDRIGKESVIDFYESDGVEQTFAVQAGREIRVLVKPEQVNDEATVFLAKEIAEKLENELEYPGQIKVNVIREVRSVEYAK